jgi:acetolactate synthase-1/2/3 large subunit
MSPVQRITVGELVAAFLERCGVACAFGVISIHNMPILDAFGRRGAVRYVPARGEAGALNMADAYARVSGGLGVAVTSTGTAAGNAAGAMVEALTAGTPVLHLTGQIEVPYLDRDLAYIHEAPRQLEMLRAVSKAAYRVWTADDALPVLREAVRTALTAPAGPVSVEIPIDVQQSLIDCPDDLEPLPVPMLVPDAAALDALADAVAAAKRPLLWAGGGARGAAAEIARLAGMGIGVVTSVQGRGVLPEDHPLYLGAYNLHPPVEAFYQRCDAMLVVGSRLRSNETLTYKLKLPQALYRIDADARAEHRNYRSSRFVAADASLALAALADRLEGRLKVDPGFAADLARTREAAVKLVREGLGPYAALVDAVQAAAGRDFVWVRDVTVSNSTWGNRALAIHGPRDGVHALGGGIGQGLPMGIGAALASGGRRTFVLCGDGGLQLSLAELSTFAQERPDAVLIVMNDGGYGVIKNIQDAIYGGRRHCVEILTPDFAMLTQAIGLPHQRVSRVEDAAAALAGAGPRMVEIDMRAIGPFAAAFAGPPVRKSEPVKV